MRCSEKLMVFAERSYRSVSLRKQNAHSAGCDAPSILLANLTVVVQPFLTALALLFAAFLAGKCYGQTTGQMNTDRFLHTATMLDSGQVLIVGGESCSTECTYLNSAELYSPASDTYTYTGSLAQARSAPTVLLNNGNVLVAGGYFCDSAGNCSSLSSAELYNPSAGTFSSAGNMTVARGGQTMTLLNNGTVLIAGGQTCTTATSCMALSSAEIYDPVAATFTATANNMSAARYGASAVALDSGQVLIAGGFDGDNMQPTTEIYDLTMPGFTGNGPTLNTALFQPAVTLLNNGQVLVTGGSGCGISGLSNSPTALTGCPTDDAEIYDPNANAFSETNGMTDARWLQTATQLTNGQVVVAGGFNPCTNSRLHCGILLQSDSTTELFDPVAVVFMYDQGINGVAGQTATLMPSSGNVLLVGGIVNGQTTPQEQWYQPASLTPPSLVSISLAPTSAILAFGQTQPLVAAGKFTDGTMQNLSALMWASSNNAVAMVSNDMTNPGIVLGVAVGSATVTACAGSICGSTTITVNQANPTIVVTSSADPSVNGSSIMFTATLTPPSATGTVAFMDGGTTLGTSTISGGTARYTTSALIVGSHSITASYSGDTNDYSGTSSPITQIILPLSFVATNGQMGSPRSGHAATQLQAGTILITGGMTSSGVATSAQLYALSSGTFSPAGALNVARWLHTATLLNDGTVLVAGGSDLANEETLDTAEIYNPATETFTLLSNTLNTARVGHTATLLNNGQVLIVGGYDPDYGLIADAELYDPPTQSFIDLGDTNAPRYEHTATMLQNGQVLIAGGDIDPTPSGALNTAEIFDSPSQTFTAVPVPMTTPREGQAAVLLNNGQVLITGGDNPPAGSQNSAETYNPATSAFTALTSTMTAPRVSHLATLVNGGRVLITGGATDANGTSTALNSAEVYDPASQTFTATPSNMTSVREHQTASLLNDGTVLVVGGTNGTNVFNTAELYMPSQLSGLASIAVTPANPSVESGAQQVFSAVGTFSDGSTASLASVLWSSSNTSVAAISNDVTDSGAVASLTQGAATVTASAAGISGTAVLTITAPTLVSIDLNPQSPIVALGSTQQFFAIGIFSDGSTQDLTSSVTWSSSAPAVATVNTSGLASGLVQGVATIQASLGSISSNTSATVGPNPCSNSVTVSPDCGGGGGGGGGTTPTISVATSGTPSAYGNPVTLTATVTSGDAGTVTFYNGSASIGTATPSSGAARLTTSNLPVGSDSITATIAASGNYLTATSSAITQVVNGIYPTISLATSGGNPSTYGTSVSLTATVTSGDTGAVTFYSGTTYLGTATPSGGRATLTTSSLPVGSDSITATIATSGDYGAATSSPVSQTVTAAPPTISGLSPNSGAVGASITVSGTDFGTFQGTSKVTFNGIAANGSSWSNTSIVAAVPTGATSGDVVVSVSGVASNGVEFTRLTGSPTIASVSPSSGNAGLAVTITGSNFGSAQGQGTVQFHGAAAGVLNWSESSITAVVPTTTTGQVVVTTANGQSSTSNVSFTVTTSSCN
jgi:N-acetylneuraminic acid mutarotase